MRLVCQRFSSPLKVTRRNVWWNLLMNRRIGVRKKGQLYRWGSWKVSEPEFAGIRVRQHRDLSIIVDLEDSTNKFITEASITRERSRQRQESLTAQELSMLRGVLGTASWRAQQMSPQFAADVNPDPSNFQGKLLDQTMLKLELLHLLTNPSGWSVWPGLRCMVLRCGAGIWKKQSDKWAVCSSQILEVYLMP